MSKLSNHKAQPGPAQNNELAIKLLILRVSCFIARELRPLSVADKNRVLLAVQHEFGEQLDSLATSTET
jgi:hypothetical protein